MRLEGWESPLDSRKRLGILLHLVSGKEGVTWRRMWQEVKALVFLLEDHVRDVFYFASPLVNATLPDLQWTCLYGYFLMTHRGNPYCKLLKVSMTFTSSMRNKKDQRTNPNSGVSTNPFSFK